MQLGCFISPYLFYSNFNTFKQKPFYTVLKKASVCYLHRFLFIVGEMKLSEALDYLVGAKGVLSLISTFKYLAKFFYYCCSWMKKTKKPNKPQACILQLCKSFVLET